MSNTTLTIQSIVEKETSNFNIPHGVIDAASLAAFLTNFGSFKTALDAIILGVIRHEAVKIYDTLISGLLPASNQARRELKMLVRYSSDVSGAKFTMEIPTPDLVALTLESGDANFVQLADAGVMAAFVTAFEVLVTSPLVDTEAVTVDSIQVVGRNI